MSKTKSDGLTSLFQILGIGLMFLAFYGLSSLKSSDKLLIPLSIFALLTGVVLEGKRLTAKWSTVFYISLAAFIFSFICFLPGKREHPYIFETHVILWPYYFLFIFALISVVIHKDKVTPRLTEGITLLQSIALIYWLIDERFFDDLNWLDYSILGLVSLFTLISLFNAFTHFNLSRTNRLFLSVWSSLIMLVFAIDNIYKTFQNKEIEAVPDLNESMTIFLEYFLLGISSMYVLQNFLMLTGFLPGKGTFFNKQYFKDVHELKDYHVQRYSEEQVKILHSFICFSVTGATFFFNYRYDFLPRNLAIWIAFVIVPLLLNVLGPARQKTTANSS